MMTLRTAFLAAFSLALAACDSGGVPSPAEKLEQGTDVQAEVAQDEVMLRGQGLVAGSEAFYFAAGKAEVLGSLSKVLGQPVSEGSNAECGAGPMTSAEFDGGLKVNFQNDRFTGWYHVGESEQIRLAGDIQVGTPREALEAATGFQAVSESTLGEEFTLGDDIGGFVSEDAVSVLYAGTQCFFR